MKYVVSKYFADVFTAFLGCLQILYVQYKFFLFIIKTGNWGGVTFCTKCNVL